MLLLHKLPGWSQYCLAVAVAAALSMLTKLTTMLLLHKLPGWSQYCLAVAVAAALSMLTKLTTMLPLHTRDDWSGSCFSSWWSRYCLARYVYLTKLIKLLLHALLNWSRYSFTYITKLVKNMLLHTVERLITMCFTRYKTDHDTSLYVTKFVKNAASHR